MKLKLKLDKDSLQQFFLENGEKLVFGLIGLAALLIIFQALTRKGYEKTPQQLLQKSKDADDKINSTPPEVPAECHSAEFEKLVRRILLPVDGTAYEYGKSWDVPVANPLRPRPQPQLYAAEKLRGTAGAGKFSSQRTSRGSRDHGTRYLVLTALVPLEQQTAAYQDAFDGVRCRDPQTDGAPQYSNFKIERAVVPASGQNQELAWEDVTKDIKEAVAQLQTTDVDVVEPKYLCGKTTVASPGRMLAARSQDPLAMSLPVTNRAWGENAAHAPEIPLMNQAKTPDKPEPPPDTGDGGPPPDDQTQPQPPPDEEKNPKYGLLRVFDCTVKPGVSYRYRVSLILNNPNYGEQPIYLANPDFAKDKTLQTPKSEPSDVIFVPEDVRVLVKSVIPARTQAAEPEASVIIFDWLEKTGQTAHQEFPGKETQPVKIYRGKVLNFMDATFKLGPASKGGKGTKVPTTTIKSCLLDAVVVDMKGDGANGEVLVLDNRGRLVAHNAAEDMAVYHAWEEEESKAETAAPAGRPGVHRGGPPRRGGLDDLDQPGRLRGNKGK
jgi:hypothetical protein